jgi:hypothetical protein
VKDAADMVKNPADTVNFHIVSFKPQADPAKDAAAVLKLEADSVTELRDSCLS